MRRRFLRTNSTAAFTLIELLVVIVILGILMAVAVPTFLRQQTKAQDSRTQQYLTTAYKAIRSGTPDTGNQYSSSTSMVSWVQQSEPELTVQRAGCYTGTATAPTDAVLVDPSSSANSLLLCARSASGDVWELSATATSAPTLINGTLVPLTLNGSQINDATRAAAPSWNTSQQGGQTDGLGAPSDTYIGRAATNLWGHGQDDAVGGANYGSGQSVSLDPSTPAPFSPQSVKIVTGANYAGRGFSTAGGLAAPAGTRAVASFYAKRPLGDASSFRFSWKDESGNQVGLTTFPVVGTGSWQLYTAPTIIVPVGDVGDHVSLDAAGNPNQTFWIAHLMLEVGQTRVAPYVASTGGVSATQPAGRVQAPAALLSATQSWVAMRVRIEWSAAAPPYGTAANPFFFGWQDDSNNKLIGYYDAPTDEMTFRRTSGGASVTVQGPVESFAPGATKTLIFAWESGRVRISVDGAPFADAVGGDIPTLGSTLFDIGGGGTVAAGHESNSYYLWFASGTGTLSNADAATINAFGDSDPTRASFPSSAQVTMTWDGVSSTGSLK